MKRILFIISILFVAIRVVAQEFKPFYYKVPDSYNFWFYDPETEHDENAHFPLLIFLHGKSLCGTNLNSVKKYGAIDAVARGRIIDTYILAPQNPGGSWSPKKVMDIVDWAIDHYNVDTTRIYVYGMSLGGYGTLDLAAAYPDRIAAAIGLCGGATRKDLSGLSKMPLIIAHGTADKLVPVSASDKVVDAIKATGDTSRLRYFRMPGKDHGIFARVFYVMETYDWLFSHSTKDPGREINPNFEINDNLLNNAYKDLGRRANNIPEDIDDSLFE